MKSKPSAYIYNLDLLIMLPEEEKSFQGASQILYISCQILGTEMDNR